MINAKYMTGANLISVETTFPPNFSRIPGCLVANDKTTTFTIIILNKKRQDKTSVKIIGYQRTPLTK